MKCNTIKWKSLKNYIFYQLDVPEGEIQTVSLIFKIGAIQEMKNTNGSAHVLEHMMVHYISESWHSYYNTSVLCIGMTEYDYMLIRIDYSNRFADEMQYCFNIFNNIMDGKMLNERLFELSVNEVLEEYLSKGDLVESQRKLISKVTHNAIEHHPVGNLDDLKRLNLVDITYFYLNQLRHAERAIVLIGKNEVTDSDLEYLSAYPVMKNINNKVIPRKVRLEKFYTNELLRVFLSSYAPLKLTSMERILLMDVWERKYNMFAKGQISIFDKVISKDYQFIYLVGGAQEEGLIDFTRMQIEAEGLKERELDISKKRLTKYIYKCREKKIVQNTTSKLGAIIRSFLYEDDILFIDNYDIMLSSINSVQSEQINCKFQNSI